MSDITRILNAIERGNARAADQLLPLVYEELRLLAARKLSNESPGQTLQATALVHEAYLRLVAEKNQNWQGRRHFFLTTAEAMRCILIDNARRKKSAKRGGGRRRVDLDEASPIAGRDANADDLIALDEALAKLAAEDGAKAQVVELRYFAGLTVEQTAEIMGVSPTTAKLHWAYARAWLLREIGQDRSEVDS